MREVRVKASELQVGDTVVRKDYTSRIKEIRSLEAGTQLTGPRGGAKVLNREGARQGGTALILANGRKPVVYADTTVVVLRDDMDY